MGIDSIMTVVQPGNRRRGQFYGGTRLVDHPHAQLIHPDNPFQRPWPQAGDLDDFPRPNLSMMLTSLFLSVLPTSLFAMVVLSMAQSRTRVNRAETRIREIHRETITRLQDEGVLRLRWDEPLLADAEFLLSVGTAEVER